MYNLLRQMKFIFLGLIQFVLLSAVPIDSMAQPTEAPAAAQSAETRAADSINMLNLDAVIEALKQKNLEATSLNAALSQAIKDNPSFLAAKADYEATIAAYDKDFGALLPKLDLVANGAGEIIRNDTTISRYESEQNSVITNKEALILSQLLWDGGTTTGKVSASKLNAASTREQAFNTGEEIILKATHQYIDVLRYEGLRELSLQNVATHQNIVALTQDRFNFGVGNMADVAQAQASMDEAKARALNAQQNLDEAKAAYVRLFGVEVGGLRLPDLPLHALPASLENAQSIAMSNNAAIKAADLGVKKREKEVQSAQGRFFPVLSFQAAAGRSDNTNGYTESYHGCSAGLNFRWNLFNGNSDMALITETNAQLRQAQQKREEIRRSLNEEVRNSWNFPITTKNLIPELRSSVSMNKEALVNYIAQFRIGRRTLLDVLSAEKSLYSAQQTLLNAYLANNYVYFRILMPLSQLTQAMDLNLNISDGPK